MAPCLATRSPAATRRPPLAQPGQPPSRWPRGLNAHPTYHLRPRSSAKFALRRRTAVVPPAATRAASHPQPSRPLPPPRTLRRRSLPSRRTIERPGRSPRRLRTRRMAPRRCRTKAVDQPSAVENGPCAAHRHSSAARSTSAHRRCRRCSGATRRRPAVRRPVSAAARSPSPRCRSTRCSPSPGLRPCRRHCRCLAHAFPQVGQPRVRQAR